MMKKQENNGAIWSSIEFPNMIGVSTFDTVRLTYKGNFCVNLLKKADKYDKEIQFQIYTDNIKMDKRASKDCKWNRMEFFIPLDMIDSLIKSLQILKDESSNIH